MIYIFANSVTEIFNGVYNQFQKWIMPFISYETTYFLLAEGRILIELRCCQGSTSVC